MYRQTDSQMLLMWPTTPKKFVILFKLYQIIDRRKLG
jgi:hypothetical protein